MSRQKNKAASVRQLLLDRSRKNSESFQFLLTRYGLERLLYRLSLSEYEPYFVLKGAMLFPIWGINGHRPTMDADLLGFGESTEAHVREVFQELCRLDVEDDGLLFAPEDIRVEVIREEMEYGGVRVKLIAELDKAHIPLQIDIGYGDAVTPPALEIEYPTLLDMPAPHLRVYPRESVIAEKFHAMVLLGMGNSRIKDVYDIWVLARLFEYSGTVLAQALARTFERRQTAIPQQTPLALTGEFYGDAAKQALWRGFIKRNNLMKQDVGLEEAVRTIGYLLLPVCEALNKGLDFPLFWPMGGPWR